MSGLPPAGLFVSALASLAITCCLANDRENRQSQEDKAVELRSGDLVFQDSSPVSGQAEAIKRLTRSQWSHCGIYFVRPELGAVVVDGNGRGPLMSWEKWKARGKDGKCAVYRPRKAPTEAQLEQLWASARLLDEKPYDLKFAWDDANIYCSELIWKAWRKAFGAELVRLQALRDFELEDSSARALIEREGSWGTLENAKAHGDEPVISPRAITESLLLDRVTPGARPS